jgi:hypothetical protein
MIHESHALVAKTRDKETAKSCGPCARVLWSNVLGYIKIASSSGSGTQVRLGFTNLDVDIRAFSWVTHRGCTVGPVGYCGGELVALTL